MRTMTALHAVIFRRLTSCFDVSNTNCYQIATRQVTRSGSMKQEPLKQDHLQAKEETQNATSQEVLFNKYKAIEFYFVINCIILSK